MFIKIDSRRSYGLTNSRGGGIGDISITVENYLGQEAKAESIYDDEKKILRIMLKDANENGQYMSYLPQKLGVKSGGYK